MAELKDGSGLVFIGQKRGVAMSDMTLGGVLKRMGRGDLAAHGFRSTLSDWAHETTRHEHIVIEVALAHVSGDKVASAHHRGDLFEKRKALIVDWAAFLTRKPAEIVRLPKGQVTNRLTKAEIRA